MIDTLLRWYGRMICRHEHAYLERVTFDGDALYKCVDCGKTIYTRLK